MSKEQGNQQADKILDAAVRIFVSEKMNMLHTASLPNLEDVTNDKKLEPFFLLAASGGVRFGFIEATKIFLGEPVAHLLEIVVAQKAEEEVDRKMIEFYETNSEAQEVIKMLGLEEKINTIRDEVHKNNPTKPAPTYKEPDLSWLPRVENRPPANKSADCC